MRRDKVLSVWGFRPNLGALDFAGGPNALMLIGYEGEKSRLRRRGA